MKFFLQTQEIRYQLVLWCKFCLNLSKAAWIIKCRAVVKQNYIDDIELDEEGVAEVLMDENAVASVPR